MSTAIASESRKFQMHEKLLLDVIMKQAGSIEKAMLEAVMNSIEAGGSKVIITVLARQIIVVDDGKGFRNREEIEKFFETFGQPHDASEGKKWAQFRMGRGQMFAFGKNEWRTGTFKMNVDIKAKLGYDLTENLKDEKGCRVVIDLYQPLNPREVNVIVQEIEHNVKYVSIPVEVNGVKVNQNPDERKWATINEDGYFNLTDGQRLAVYNMGVHVTDLGKHVFGCGGTIVSKDRLEVNFARNDIIRSCSAWRKIQKEIEKYAPKVKQKHSLDDDERENMIARLVAGELSYHDASKMPLLVDASGHPWSFRRLNNSTYRVYSIAPTNDRTADRLIQSGQALILDENIVKLFKVKPENLLSHKFTFTNGYQQAFGGAKFAPFAELAKSVKTGYFQVPKDRWSKSENKWAKVIEKASHAVARMAGVGPRTILIGRSETAAAWTDGSSYIAFEQNYLRRNMLVKNGVANVSSVTDVMLTLLHEYCHDDDSTGNGHPPEFYKRFHDGALGLGGTKWTKGQEYFPERSMSDVVSMLMGWLTPKQLDSLDKNTKGEADENAVEKNVEPEKIAALEAPTETPKPEIKVEPSTPKAPSEPKPAGTRMAKDVTDPAEIAAIKAARAAGKGWKQIEVAFGLKPTKGMTAYRICNPDAK